MKYVPPEFWKDAFHCPHCQVYSHQNWDRVYRLFGGGVEQLDLVAVSRCTHCEEYSVWVSEQMLFPRITAAPLPHPEMPEDVKADYEEAKRVFGDSARSSAALLRLAIQKLCKQVGQPGKNLNDDIGALVKVGLPVTIQRSLDILRVVGNNQVHPGVLDVRDDPTIAASLFELVNLIVEDRIARPKQIEALYSKLPESARNQIEQRDLKAKTGS